MCSNPTHEGNHKDCMLEIASVGRYSFGVPPSYTTNDKITLEHFDANGKFGRKKTYKYGRPHSTMKGVSDVNN